MPSWLRWKKFLIERLELKALLWCALIQLRKHDNRLDLTYFKKHQDHAQATQLHISTNLANAPIPTPASASFHEAHHLSFHDILISPKNSELNLQSTHDGTTSFDIDQDDQQFSLDLNTLISSTDTMIELDPLLRLTHTISDLDVLLRSTDPTEKTFPVLQTDPFGQTNPNIHTDPTGPTDPNLQTDPIGPSDPIGPTNPIGPTDPIRDTDPIGPTNPILQNDLYSISTPLGVNLVLNQSEKKTDHTTNPCEDQQATDCQTEATVTEVDGSSIAGHLDLIPENDIIKTSHQHDTTLETLDINSVSRNFSC